MCLRFDDLCFPFNNAWLLGGKIKNNDKKKTLVN